MMMAEGDLSKAYKQTENGVIIPGGTTPTVQNVTITTPSSWIPITLPADTHCKQLLVKTRAAGTKFRLASTTEGTPDYITLESVTIEMGGDPETTMFYVKDDGADIVLEILSVD